MIRHEAVNSDQIYFIAIDSNEEHAGENAKVFTTSENYVIASRNRQICREQREREYVRVG
ncbi:MAG: hypothetical protein GWN41_00160 [Phycisphaerae bacterium]|nr:hypothetical protein [Phycisphaerae bacterium]